MLDQSKRVSEGKRGQQAAAAMRGMTVRGASSLEGGRQGG